LKYSADKLLQYIGIWLIGLMIMLIGLYLNPEVFIKLEDPGEPKLHLASKLLYILSVGINFYLGYIFASSNEKNAQYPLLRLSLLTISSLIMGTVFSLLDFWFGIWIFYPR